MKKVVILLLILIFFLSSFPSLQFPGVFGKDLSLLVRFDQDRVAIDNTSLSIYCQTNLDALLSISFQVNKREIIAYENLSIESDIEKVIKIPIVYPIISDFEIFVNAESMDSSLKASFSKSFIFRKKILGQEQIKGRITNCSNSNKTGIEGAKIEIISGPTIGYTYSEDDGYFSLDDLPKGIYKLGVSHICSKTLTEKIVVVDNNTPFTEVCLDLYGIPDFDFWLNKPSGSSFEVGETISFHLRTSLNMKADLILSNENTDHEIFNNFNLTENELQNFYWVVPEKIALGKHTLTLVPKDKSVCGVAKYHVNFTGMLKKGSVHGQVAIDGIPLKNVEVYLPLQFNEHVFSNEFGHYEIKNVSPGIHVIRFLMEGYEQADLRGIEVSSSQTTQSPLVNLKQSETMFQVFPNPILAISHERREKVIPLEISLTKGFTKNIVIEPIDFPEGLYLSSTTIPSLTQEKQIIKLIISDKLLPDTYPIKIRIKSQDAELEIPGIITVAGLSFGTFDGFVSPKSVTIPQSYRADFLFKANRFTNFNSPIRVKFNNVPLYTKINFNAEPFSPPFDLHFSLETSLSTPSGEYRILLEATGDNQTMTFPFTLEVIQSGASLKTIPETGWNPIIEPGKNTSIPIALFSYKGLSKNVRVNLDFGPNWLVVNNRILGNVGEKKVFAHLEFVPNEFMQPGGYDYSISFSYGERNEGYRKFSGRIYVSSVDPDIPSNLRAKFVEENHKIVLTWGPPSEDKGDIIGYNIYKSLHYPSLESAFPINNSLLKDRYFEDTDYKIGKTYWYVVKAVKVDGSISKKSNTAELAIIIREKLLVQFLVDKGEKATYFVGEKINFFFQTNLSGSFSIKIKTENFEVLMGQKSVAKNLPYFLSYPTPDFPMESTIIGTFIGSNGQRIEVKKNIFIKKSKEGTRNIKGILWNPTWDKPVPYGKITTFEGSTKRTTESDKNGLFQINGLSDGVYRFLIETEMFKMVSESFSVGDENSNLGKISVVPPDDKSLLIWTNSDLIQPYIRSNPLSIYAQSQTSTTITITIKHDFIERVLITNKAIEAGQVMWEKINLPIDLPPGPGTICIRDTQKNISKSIRFLIEEPLNGMWGKVFDIHDSPIEKVSTSNTITNEWGFFYLPDTPTILEFKKQNYLTQKIEINDLLKNHTIAMLMDIGVTKNIQTELQISEDFNDFTFNFSSQNGRSNNFKIIIDPEAKLYESPEFDLLPGYIYQFSFNNLLRDQIQESSTLMMKSNGVSSVVRLVKGLKDKLFLDSDPEIIILKAGEENLISLDLYSYGLYKKNQILSATFFDPEIKTFFEPVNLIPGNTSVFHISIPKDHLPGNYFFVIQVKSELLEVQIPFSYTLKEKEIYFIEKEWNPVLYEKGEALFDFYLSEKPISIISNSVPEGFAITINDQSVSIALKKNQVEKSVDTLSFTINDTQNLSINISAETIAKESWVPPTISLLSIKEGVKLLVAKNGYEQYYFINRPSHSESVCFLNDSPMNAQESIDTTAVSGQKYIYSVFSTNGRLEAGWSNQEEILYNQLTMKIDLKDEIITNRSKFQITGSVTIGSELTINKQLINIEKNGLFKTYVDLKEGKNVFIFLLQDQNNNKLEATRTIYLDTIAPFIKQIDPLLTDVQTTENKFLIRFESENEAYVTINSNRIFPKNEGFFEYQSNLLPGQNTFTITANDKVGNQSILILQFYRYKNITYISLRIGNKTAIVNQKTIPLEVPPQIIQGRTLVPIRFIADSFGAKVEWKVETKEILISWDKITMTLQIGSKNAKLNGVQTIPLEVPPQIIQGRTLVPIRFIADSFGAKVEWKVETKEILIHLFQPF